MGTCRGMAAQTPSSEMLTGWETAGMRCSLSKLFPSHCATPCPSQHMWRAHTGTGTGKQTAPVSDLTICYLSLHCCSAFTFLVVISHTDKTIFSNTRFVIWFFFFYIQLFSLSSQCLKKGIRLVFWKIKIIVIWIITSRMLNNRRHIWNTMLGHTFPFWKDTLIWGERCEERRVLLPCQVIK